ncbi:ABC transporter substrate-binding protein [Bacillus sp. REN16]|uniref:ABC transporter substrate-binding protein n=1 Tax=Bacillus sp. REN16 TaxID=2887296 RepID=UPI001E64F0EB|nr:iron-siderophore ABC transporter substrate-binding protein [Bacillus sp. REN16]MCC3355806.1 iron-siderophore ABC transporter substrate-binding protein [Bacillus sp. REN16]
MNIRKKIYLGFLTLAIATLVLAACGAADNTDKNEAVENSNTYTIEHAMGTTPINKDPKKIVVLTNEGTEALLAMGVKPVGAVRSWIGDPWYDHIEDQMEGVEVVGEESNVNIEAIAALEPDLIIGNKMRQENIYEQLKAIAPTVFAEDLRGDWQKNFTLYSKAINKEEEGKKVLADFEDHVNKVKENINTDTAVSVVRFMEGRTRIYYTDSFSGVIFDKLGLKRPEQQVELFAQDENDQFAREVDQEKIPLMDGDVIFYFTYETGTGEATKVEEEWINNPLWKGLTAVKDGNVHKVSDPIWNTAGGVLAANLMLDDIEKYLAK